MKITVKLYGVLRKYRPDDAEGAPHHPFPYNLPENNTNTIHDLMTTLNIAQGAVNAAAINGDAVDNDAVLHNGDTVSLFPPSAGGAS